MKQLFIEKYGVDTPVRALSWKQPFASLMLHGKVETRVWDSRYFGWVLICASQSPYNVNDLYNITEDQMHRGITTLGYKEVTRLYKTTTQLRPDTLPLGKAIAIGRLYDSRKLDDFSFVRKIDDNRSYEQQVKDETFVKYNKDLFGHSYTDVQTIEPFDWKGKQGWSTLTDEVKSKIILL